jgi:transposase
VARARRRWQRRQGGLDPARLVFIDESAAKTNLTRLRGRAPRGERLVCHAPHGHWHTTTMISSVRLDGTSACLTIEGATDTEVFQAYVREVLVPALRTGDIVVMDNLGAHKNDGTLALIAQAGAEVRFLPAYSPDLNPIEMMWSKVKSLLRKAEARTQDQLLSAIAAALRAVTAQDALGWFVACGYNFI